MTRPDMGVVTVGLAKVDIVGDSGVDDCWGSREVEINTIIR